jgi:hypothetical protein
VKNQQKKSQALTFYIVMRSGKIWRVDDDGKLSPKESHEAGTLFDDYGQARNAIRRTEKKWKKIWPRECAETPFKIGRVGF